MSSTFKELATSANLLGSEVHKVKEVWTGQRNLKATDHAAKASPKVTLFPGHTAHWIAQNHGLQGDTCPPRPFAGAVLSVVQKREAEQW